jgi:CDP-glycerol glycerophosphotransferase
VVVPFSNVEGYLTVSPGPHVIDMFRSALKFTCEVLKVGYPRNDMLFHADRCTRAAEIRAALGIPSGRRAVLYVFGGRVR